MLLAADGGRPDQSDVMRLAEIVLGLDAELEKGPSSDELDFEEEQRLSMSLAGETKQRRLGIDTRLPESTRSILSAAGVEMVEVTSDSPGADDELQVDLLLLHIEDDVDAEGAYQRCQALRGLFADPELPILLSIPRHEEKLIREVFAAGADDFVARPIVGPRWWRRRMDRARPEPALAGAIRRGRGRVSAGGIARSDER